MTGRKNGAFIDFARKVGVVSGAVIAASTIMAFVYDALVTKKIEASEARSMSVANAAIERLELMDRRQLMMQRAMRYPVGSKQRNELLDALEEGPSVERRH